MNRKGIKYLIKIDFQLYLELQEDRVGGEVQTYKR